MSQVIEAVYESSNWGSVWVK